LKEYQGHGEIESGIAASSRQQSERCWGNRVWGPEDRATRAVAETSPL
jgi:hypothetical protein